MFWTYLLRCSDDSFYCGHTDELKRRIGQHQNGETGGYTAIRRPVRLVWSQEFPSRLEALTAERQIKGWSRHKKQALVDGDWDLVSLLARKSFDTASRPSTSSGVRHLLRTNGGRVERKYGSTPPIIVLVRPQLAENIGKAARAMLNFGLTELRLVAPRDGWPNPDAGPAASGADIVLANAQLFDSVGDAVADCEQVYATTVRRRDVIKPVVSPEDAARDIRASQTRTAILFGPERAGLETADVAIARTILTVPVNPAFGSLNLAQAVMVVAYEWSRGETLAQPPRRDDVPPAPQSELDGMIGQLETLLDEAGFFYPPDKAPLTRNMLRSLLTKPGWSPQEVRTMRGVLSSLQPLRRSKTSSS